MSTGTTATYRPDIDGLRAVAILLVVAYHCGLPGFSGGFIGVDVFFVISGYLITGLLARELAVTGRIAWVAFFARRARRLVPAAALMIITVLALSAWILNPLGERQAMAKSAIAASLSGSNLYFWKYAPADYFGGGSAASPMLHTWSLSVEEQFYLALPMAVTLALVVARKTGRNPRGVLLVSAWGLSAISLVVATVWAGGGHESAVFYLPISRAYEFGVGAVLALSITGSLRRWRNAAGVIGCLLLLGCLVFPLPSQGFPGSWGLMPTIATALIIGSGPGCGTVRRVLSAQPMVGVGRVSYGWYLWHWPLIALAGVWNLGPVGSMHRVALSLAAFGIAILSYRLVEQRFHRSASELGGATANILPGSRQMRPWGVVVAGGSVLGGLALMAAALGIAAGFDSREPKWEAVSAQQEDFPLLPPDCLDGPDSVFTSLSEPCFVTPFRAGRPTLVLWGDSHAWQYLPSLLKVASLTRVNLLAWAAGGCPPSLVPTDAYSGSEASEAATWQRCATRNVNAIEYVERLAQGGKGLRVVLGARWGVYRGVEPVSITDRRASTTTDTRPHYEALGKGIETAVARLSAADVTVDVVGPIPELPRSAPLCLALAWRTYDCDVSRDTFEERNASVSQWLHGLVEDAAAGSRLIDVSRSLCNAHTCYAAHGGIVNYFDDDHLSATKAATLDRHFHVSIPSRTEALRKFADQ